MIKTSISHIKLVTISILLRLLLSIGKLNNEDWLVSSYK